MPHHEHPPNLELSAWIARQFPPGVGQYVVDVGASDGISCNSTLGLEQMRWTCLCVEPNPQFWPRLKELRAFVMTCACGAEAKDEAEFFVFDHNPEAYSALVPRSPNGFVAEITGGPVGGPGWTKLKVPVKTLDQCLEEAQFPRLDVLCLDCEGGEMDVLSGFDLDKWQPRVAIIESWDANNSSIIGFMAAHHYERVHRLIDNDYFILKPRGTWT